MQYTISEAFEQHDLSVLTRAQEDELYRRYQGYTALRDAILDSEVSSGFLNEDEAYESSRIAQSFQSRLIDGDKLERKKAWAELIEALNAEAALHLHTAEYGREQWKEILAKVKK